MLDDTPKTVEDIASRSPIYEMGEERFALYRYFEEKMIEKHLELLEASGHIHRSDQGYYL
jgi:hypothetical protein